MVPTGHSGGEKQSVTRITIDTVKRLPAHLAQVDLKACTYDCHFIKIEDITEIKCCLQGVSCDGECILSV